MRKGKLAHKISPVAMEAMAKRDALFDIEHITNGLPTEAHSETWQELSRPLVEELHDWLVNQQALITKHNPVAKAIKYILDKGDRWLAFMRFLEDGRLCLTNNAAERALRRIALGRKAWLFAGSERDGDRAAFTCSLIVTVKMNNIDSQARLADVIARTPVLLLPELLP